MVHHQMLVMLFDFWVNEVIDKIIECLLFVSFFLFFFFLSYELCYLFFLGCNPKIKNNEGLIPKKIADQCKAKDAKKNMRKAEKGYNDMTANLRQGILI